MTAIDSPEVIKAINSRIKRDKSFLPLSMMLFRLKGKPYTLKNHYMFEPMFRFDLPRAAVWKTGRQVGKSNSLAASKNTMGIVMPDYNILLVCPLFSQIKRLNTQYCKPLLQQTPFQEHFLDSFGENSIYQRTYKSRSIHYFSHAFLDAERLRGYPTSEVNIDEVQGFNWDFIPIVIETMSGSERYRNIRYTGTPLTFDNTIEKLWEKCSQAVWGTRCEHCNHWNLACVDMDLLEMIRPTGVSCSKCGKGIDPATGCWIHSHPDRRNSFEGYHIPQPIHPYHYRNILNWKELLHKQRTYPVYRFYNECLGESYDNASKLITLLHLKAACTIQRQNTLQNAAGSLGHYRKVVMGIDWGGGGGEESVSHTAFSVAGLRRTGDDIDIIFAQRFPRSTSPQEEVQFLLEVIRAIKPDFIAHDYGGAGALHETLLIQAGMPANKLLPFTYVMSPKKPIISYEADPKGYRSSYSLDKARSLMVLCAMIKAGKVNFCEYESYSDQLSGSEGETQDVNLLEDFLALILERREMVYGSDVLLVGKAAGKPDDIAHSANLACAALWHTNGKYPNIAEAEKLRLTREQINEISPTNIHAAWLQKELEQEYRSGLDGNG